MKRNTGLSMKAGICHDLLNMTANKPSAKKKPHIEACLALLGEEGTPLPTRSFERVADLVQLPGS